VAQPAQVAAASETNHERLAWRSWVPWAIVVLAAVIALVAALNVWVKRQALSTDAWTNASAQLLENDQIRQAVSVYLVNQLYTNVNVSQELQQELPPPVKPLAPQIALGLQQVLVRATDTLLARPRVQQLWKNANRRAHQLFIAVLDGKHNVLQSSNGNVVLNLQPILQALAKQTGIGSRLQGRLPPDAGKITIMKGNQLDTARKSVKVIRVMSYFLLFLVIALYALAMYLSRDRRKILLGAGVSVLVVGLLILVVRRFAGNYLVDQLTNNPDAKKAVTATWAIGTELLRNVGENAIIYGLVVIFAAWIAGPSRPATWCRRVSAPTIRNHPVVLYGAVTLVLILVLLAGPTDAQRVYPLLFLFALAYVGTEWLRRHTNREFPAQPAAGQLPAA
jgi:Ca2+/Na+ antiporter